MNWLARLLDSGLRIVCWALGIIIVIGVAEILISDAFSGGDTETNGGAGRGAVSVTELQSP